MSTSGNLLDIDNGKSNSEDEGKTIAVEEKVLRVSGKSAKYIAEQLKNFKSKLGDEVLSLILSLRSKGNIMHDIIHNLKSFVEWDNRNCTEMRFVRFRLP